VEILISSGEWTKAFKSTTNSKNKNTPQKASAEDPCM